MAKKLVILAVIASGGWWVWDRFLPFARCPACDGRGWLEYENAGEKLRKQCAWCDGDGSTTPAGARDIRDALGTALR